MSDLHAWLRVAVGNLRVEFRSGVDPDGAASPRVQVGVGVSVTARRVRQQPVWPGGYRAVAAGRPAADRVRRRPG